MLHRNYLILMIVTLIIFSPQASVIGLAEEASNESVYENINKEKDLIEESTEDPLIDNEQEVEPAVQGDSLSVTAFDFIKMLIALAFVLFLVYFLLKFVTKRNRQFQKGQSIVNLGGTSLGQSKSIQMIKIGNRILVIGVGESISLLKEIDNEQERKIIIEEFEQKQDLIVEPKDFIQKVFTFLNHNKANRSIESGETFSTSFKDQLEKVKNERSKQLEDVKRKGLNKHE